MLNPGGTITSHLHSAATYLSSDGEGLFAFSSNAGNILLIKMPPPEIQGMSTFYLSKLQHAIFRIKLIDGEYMIFKNLSVCF